MIANKMINFYHLSSVSKLFKRASNNCFFKSGFFNFTNECTGPMKFVKKRRTCIPNLLNSPSNAAFNISSSLCNLHKLLNNSSSRTMSTIDKYTSTTEADEEKRKLIEIEIDLLKEEGHQEIPSTLTAQEWLELVDMESHSARVRFLRHLFIREHRKKQHHVERKQAHEMIKDRRKQVEEELLESEKTGLSSYGLWRNSIFMKWDDKRMNYIRENGVATAALYGQHIVFDNFFDYCMTRHEKKDVVQQFAMAIGSNREHVDPFYFHICNFSLKRELSQRMVRYIPTLLEKSYPVETHSENYLEHFPRDRLVYVTPYAKEDMTNFDHNAVYIIGNLIRQGQNNTVEVAKAKKEGIKMQRFPLDRYLDWGLGTKSLPVNLVLRILLDFKHTGSWVTAFDLNIPKRKLFKQAASETDQIKEAMRKPQYSQKTFNSKSRGWSNR